MDAAAKFVSELIEILLHHRVHISVWLQQQWWHLIPLMTPLPLRRPLQGFLGLHRVEPRLWNMPTCFFANLALKPDLEVCCDHVINVIPPVKTASWCTSEGTSSLRSKHIFMTRPTFPVAFPCHNFLIYLFLRSARFFLCIAEISTAISNSSVGSIVVSIVPIVCQDLVMCIDSLYNETLSPWNDQALYQTAPLSNILLTFNSYWYS